MYLLFKHFRWRKEHGDASSSEEESADNKSGSGDSDDSESDEDVCCFIIILRLFSQLPKITSWAQTCTYLTSCVLLFVLNRYLISAVQTTARQSQYDTCALYGYITGDLAKPSPFYVLSTINGSSAAGLVDSDFEISDAKYKVVIWFAFNNTYQ